MRSWGLSVEASEAENVRRRLQGKGLLRHDLVPLKKGTTVIFPLIGIPPSEPIGGVPLEAEFEGATPSPTGSYLKRVNGVPPDVLRKLPRAFDVVGDIVVVRLPRTADPYLAEVGRALLDHLPRARVVAIDRGVRGSSRLRTLERIAGEGGFQTVHRENGLPFIVDLEAAYFSPRLAGEHLRLAETAGPSERWLDLFCGIGPFALTFLKRRAQGRASALDANPAAIRLLEVNARVLKVADRIEPLLGDAGVILRDRASPVDRLVMNLPHEGAKFLGFAAPQVVPGGWLHIYEVVDRSREAERPREIAHSLGESTGERPWASIERHVVHPYSPRSDLVGMTFGRPM